MPWVEFDADHDFWFRKKALIAYRKGMRELVSQACAREAIAGGKAHVIERPQKEQNAKR